MNNNYYYILPDRLFLNSVTQECENVAAAVNFDVKRINVQIRQIKRRLNETLISTKSTKINVRNKESQQTDHDCRITRSKTLKRKSDAVGDPRSGKQKIRKLNDSQKESQQSDHDCRETRSKTDKLVETFKTKRLVVKLTRITDKEIKSRANSSQVLGSEEVHTIKHNASHVVVAASQTKPPKKVVALPDFKVNEVVWGKIRGFVAWPAKIIEINNKQYSVHWFNDYRTSKLYKSQLLNFYQNFEKCAENFDKKIGLKTAAQEAMMYLANPMNDMR